MVSGSAGARKDSRGEIAALLERQKIPEAVEFAEHLQADGTADDALALWLLGQARSWHTKGFFAEQKRVCELALSHVPEHFEALHLRGFHAQTEGDYAIAEKYWHRALASKPSYAFSQLALAQIRMMRTEFREGRDMYEARFEAVFEASGPDWRGLPIARWRGEPLAGKRLYLWAEQGLGDIVMFAAFLPHLLAEKPARVALGMFPKLVSMFARSFPGIDVEPIDQAGLHALAPVALASLPQIRELAKTAAVLVPLDMLQASYTYAQRHGMFDYAAPMGDLLVQYMPGFIPADRQPPYLAAEPKRLAEIRAKLATPGPGRLVGISWHTQNTREVTRNIPLEEWLPLLSAPGCRFVSLQHGVPAEEVERFCAANGCRIHTGHGIDFLQDAEGLVALIAAMNHIITIDNSNVHLAGALGVPTTLLLPKGCNYRWPEREGDNTLWYKSVKTLRQQKLYDWEPVIASAAQTLCGR